MTTTNASDQPSSQVVAPGTDEGGGAASATGRPTGSKARALWPKEHGAYGQIAMPAATALAVGSPTWVSGLLTVAAGAAFVAHEPLLVALGLRGRRAQREHGARARRVGLGCVALALATGLGAWALGGRSVLVASALPLALVVALVPFVLAGRERTTPGEVLAGAALSSASLPIATAGGVPPGPALALWAAWTIAFAASTAAVRLVIARHKSGRRDRTLLATAAAATGAAVLLVARSPYGLATLPMVLAGWVLVARPPHPRNLRRVGWTLVACSGLTAAIAMAVARVVG